MNNLRMKNNQEDEIKKKRKKRRDILSDYMITNFVKITKNPIIYLDILVVEIVSVIPSTEKSSSTLGSNL